jgi:hypothetical protein
VKKIGFERVYTIITKNGDLYQRIPVGDITPTTSVLYKDDKQKEAIIYF